MNLGTTSKIELVQEITIPNTPVDTTGTGTTWINPGMAALLRVLGELVDELKRSINFYINQAAEIEVAQLLLAGPGAAIGQVDEYFQEKLSLPTVKIDPINALSLNIDQEISPVERAGLGTVLGLGLRSL
jgi:type IV pilus assembly protein PilM